MAISSFLLAGMPRATLTKKPSLGDQRVEEPRSLTPRNNVPVLNFTYMREISCYLFMPLLLGDFLLLTAELSLDPSLDEETEASLRLEHPLWVLSPGLSIPSVQCHPSTPTLRCPVLRTSICPLSASTALPTVSGWHLFRLLGARAVPIVTHRDGNPSCDHHKNDKRPHPFL